MRLAICSALLLLTACAEVQTYGTMAIEQRRTMNDMQGGPPWPPPATSRSGPTSAS